MGNFVRAVILDCVLRKTLSNDVFGFAIVRLPLWSNSPRSFFFQKSWSSDHPSTKEPRHVHVFDRSSERHRGHQTNCPIIFATAICPDVLGIDSYPRLQAIAYPRLQHRQRTPVVPYRSWTSSTKAKNRRGGEKPKNRKTDTYPESYISAKRRSYDDDAWSN